MTQRSFHFEDVEFMAEHGETWDAVVARLGVKRTTIEAGLHRSGRREVLARITSNSVTNESAFMHGWTTA